jgi:hypothetical protein
MISCFYAKAGDELGFGQKKSTEPAKASPMLGF